MRIAAMDLHAPCFDCGVETFPHQMYMVWDDVWVFEAGMRYDKMCWEGHDHRFLCLPCLGKRVGRTLTINDFPPYPINKEWRPFCREVA